MRVYQSTQIEVTIPASPKAKRLPQGSTSRVPLRQIRRELNLPEKEVAISAGLGDDELRLLEAHQVPEIHRLAKYVKALGGELQLSVAFGTKTYLLTMDADAAPSSEKEPSQGWGELDDPFPESPDRRGAGHMPRPE
jgi:hypothetical protein